MGVILVFRNNFILLFLFFTLSAFSQTEISGRVTSVSGETLPGASVLLKNSAQAIAAYSITEDNGRYMLEAKTPGDFTIEVNFLGYEKLVFAITVVDDKAIKKDFILKEGGEMLREVVIEAEAPVKRRGDTLSYDAKALSTGHEVVVEDLLKNIPGITIDADGTIKYGDTTIEKVMVDGDDLFNKGYSLLTKNMPTQPLDKIEVLRNYSKNKLLKGIENPDGVALNLTIDEKFKTIWFGNLTLGGGNNERYKASGNLMNFGKKYKNFFSASANNAGIDDVGNIEDMRYNASDIETIGMNSRASQAMYLGAGVVRIDASRARFNNNKRANFSTIMPLGNKTKLRLNGFLGFDRLNTYQSSYSVYDFGDTYFANSQVNNTSTGVRTGYASAYITSDLSATQMLQSLTTINNGKNDFDNSLVFNGVPTNEQLLTKNTYIDQQLTYTRKWKDRNVVLLKSRFLNDRLPQTYGVDDYLMGDLFTYDNINAVGNKVNSLMQYAGLQADFKLKQKNNDLVAFTVGFENHHDNIATQFSLFTDAGTVRPDDFQADASYNVGDLYADSGYTWKFKKFSVDGTLSAHLLFNRFENGTGTMSNQNPFYINPTLNAKWQLGPDNFLFAGYTYNVTNSNILQVNDAYLLTSSRGFNKGLGRFNQLESSRATVGYSARHYLNRYGFSVGLNYSKQNDVLSYRSQLDQNSSLSEAFIMRGGDSEGITISSHYVVRALNGTVGFTANGFRAVYYNQVNGSGLRKNISYNQIYKLSWNSSFKSAFNFKLGSEWNFSQVQSDYTFKNTSKTSYLDLIYALTEKIDIKARGEHYNFGGLDGNNNYFFADFEATYKFRKDKYALMLEGRNLFNTDTFTTYSVSDLGYTTSSFRLLPRYVMLSFRFRF
ncbi:carboxypeptidase-like regulatory domain-containing protein [Flavobacterium sp. RHBU_24]|uniref:TonB-dependent receptor n=1 Tax=Flavobacterium sp. RHBU_24 TaxID=3391185 RepID=UPI003984E3AB